MNRRRETILQRIQTAQYKIRHTDRRVKYDNLGVVNLVISTWLLGRHGACSIAGQDTGIAVRF